MTLMEWTLRFTKHILDKVTYDPLIPLEEQRERIIKYGEDTAITYYENAHEYDSPEEAADVDMSWED